MQCSEWKSMLLSLGDMILGEIRIIEGSVSRAKVHVNMCLY